MSDRWAYPIPMGMQRQTGSARKMPKATGPTLIKSPSVAPADDRAEISDAEAMRADEAALGTPGKAAR